MSFFRDNATYSEGYGNEIAPEGMYTCRLKEVVKGTRPDYNNPALLKPKFDWVFETTEARDSEGRPYRFRTTTNTSYGNDQAGLTKLLDQMLGKRLTGEEFQNLNLNDLKMRLWRLTVEEGTTGRGNPCNNVTAVRPSKEPETALGKPAPKVLARVTPRNDSTPFADD